MQRRDSLPCTQPHIALTCMQRYIALTNMQRYIALIYIQRYIALTCMQQWVVLAHHLCAAVGAALLRCWTACAMPMGPRRSSRASPSVICSSMTPRSTRTSARPFQVSLSCCAGPLPSPPPTLQVSVVYRLLCVGVLSIGCCVWGCCVGVLCVGMLCVWDVVCGMLCGYCVCSCYGCLCASVCVCVAVLGVMCVLQDMCVMSQCVCI